MVAIPKDRMNADEFLAWVQTIPKDAGRFELIDGRVVERMQAERVGHTDAKGELFALFRDALKRAAVPCRAYVDGPTVRVSTSRSFRPDGLIRCGDAISADSLEINDPLLVYEVLGAVTCRQSWKPIFQWLRSNIT